jgi:hypothetical protein
VSKFGSDLASRDTLYVTSLYWTITTITTVGYGDIGGSNTLERLFCCIVMLIGVVSFSYVNGVLASIFQSMDSHDAYKKEFMEKFNKINDKYKIPEDLRTQIRKNIMNS